ncbi:MAG: EamA family transporter, partial [Planctomycetes bacterium]|nr:EamA family transporter [Planctomycetota bacterium]
TMLAHFAVTHRATDLLVPGPVIGYGLFLGVAITVVPSLLMAEGMKRIGSQRFAIISSCGPVATVVLAWAVLAEVPTVIACVGMAITLAAGIAIGAAKAPPTPTPPTTLTPTTAPEPR